MEEEIKEAVRQENVALIKKWLSKNDVDKVSFTLCSLFYSSIFPQVDEEGSTLLHFSSTIGKMEVVKLLLKKGAEVNRPDKKGWTPLHCAAFEKHLDICQTLLQKNADPSLQNSSQTTPLFYLARCKEEFVYFNNPSSSPYYSIIIIYPFTLQVKA